jgi:hypothetical protein
MLLLNVANTKPALEPYKECFDQRLLADTAYAHSIALLEGFWVSNPAAARRSATGGGTLLDL